MSTIPVTDPLSFRRCLFGGHPASAEPPCCVEQASAVAASRGERATLAAIAANLSTVTGTLVDASDIERMVGKQ